MGFINKLKNVFKGKRTVDDLRNDPNLIEVYDEYGRQLFITREEWKNNVLSGQFEKYWDNPDELYSAIVSALRDDFFQDALLPSERLLEIDPNHERAVTIRAITLMKNHDIVSAETILNEFIDEFGNTGVILTNLANVYAEQNNHRKSYTTLRNALELDPNMNNALEWIISIHNEKAGSDGVKSILEELSSIDGSWRPQLWLAREKLENKELEGAIALYRHALSKNSDADVLMMISGDLGNNGYINELIEIVTPIYNPEKHGPETGMNLLEACKHNGNYALGLDLIKRIRMQNWQPFTQKVIAYANFFDELKPIEEQHIALEQDAIHTIMIERPIWLYGIGDVTWLEGEKPESAPKILFFPLSAVDTKDTQEEEIVVQKEDEYGRLSRGLPLLLAESLYLTTSIDPRVLILAYQKRGVVLLGKTIEWTDIESIKGDSFGYVVTGEVSNSSKGFSITLHLWSTHKKEKIVTIAKTAKTTELNRLIVELHETMMNRISECISFEERPPSKLFSPIPSGLFDTYVKDLAQSLTLTLVSNDYGKPEDLWGERNIYGSVLGLAIEHKEWTAPKFLFASNLMKGVSFHSTIAKEFTKQVTSLIRDVELQSSEFDLITPMLLKHFGKSDDYRKAVEKYKGKYESQYDDWLMALEKS